MKRCTLCNGTGAEFPGDPLTAKCEECGGSGSIAMSARERAERFPDWGQVRAIGGGYPCWHFEADRAKFCLRDVNWVGHPLDHEYVMFHQMLAAVRREERERCAAIAEKMPGRPVGEGRRIAAVIRDLDGAQSLCEKGGVA